MTASALSRCASALILALACRALPALAETDAPRLHGFINQRLTSSNHGNQFFGDTSGRLSPDYSEAGVGLSWRPHNRWMLSGQAIYRRGGASEEEGVEADYLYAAFTPWESEDGRASLKLGKIKAPYGLYNDTRDTPMTRPGILAPQSIYLDSLREFNQAAPGAHLELDRTLGEHAFTLSLSQIKPNVESENVFWSFLVDRTVFPGSLHTGSGESFAGRLAYEYDGGRLRALFSHAKGPAHYRPASPFDWSGGRFDFSFSALSLQWNGEQLTLSGEFARNDFESTFTRPGFTLHRLDRGRSWYVQGQWRFHPRWEALLRYDDGAVDKNDADGVAFQAATGRAAWSRYSRDWTLGLRYRPDSQWMLAGEFHRVRGTMWLPPADNLSNGNWDPNRTAPEWNLFLLQATYQF